MPTGTLYTQEDFEQELFVYGREGEPCLVCGDILNGGRQGNRAAVWCGRCQK
jgi:formamidopyrimidine-DNA glycosylase